MRQTTLAAFAAAALTLIAGPVTAASASTLPPTVTSSFTPNLIGVGGTTALGITITNPNASGTLSNVSFTDNLPAGLTIDNPNGENGTCGSAGVVTANSGTATFSLTGGSLKAGANCTVSVAVTAAAPGALQNSTGPVTSSGPTNTAGDTETLTVLAAPTVTVATPRNNARYTFGEKVPANFSCTQPGDALDLTSCAASDDLGNDINPGGRLVTNVAGEHELTIIATSVDGLSTTDTINYEVLANNTFVVSHVTLSANGRLSFRLALPDAGKVSAVVSNGAATVGQERFTVRGKRTVGVAIQLSSAATTARLAVTFTPKGGVARKVSESRIAAS